MSLISDLRSYADSAVHQSKHTFSTARAELSGVAGRAHGAVEPYATQLRGYGDSVTDRAEELLATVKRDPRFGKAFETAESLSTGVIEFVHERVVNPVRSLTRPV